MSDADWRDLLTYKDPKNKNVFEIIRELHPSCHQQYLCILADHTSHMPQFKAIFEESGRLFLGLDEPPAVQAITREIYRRLGLSVFDILRPRER